MSDQANARETGRGSVFAIEENGTNVIAESERKGRARTLFWPWFAANISVFALSYGAWILGYGIGFWQATLVAIVGAVGSFLLVGLVSLAGKKGSAPTMILSRAAFGVRGNIFPGVISYLLLVGWETVLVVSATLATSTVFEQFGFEAGNLTKVVAFLVVIVIIVGAGILGYDVIMKVQTVLTIGLGIITIGYIALTWKDVDFSAIDSVPAGSWGAALGALVMVATGLGLGWVNSAADYSRYLPRSTSSAGVVFWTTFGAAVAPVLLIIFGLLLVISNPELVEAIGSDPSGPLATLLPTWYLVPFIIVVVGGFVAGAVLDIYSSGLTLMSIGVPVKRWVGAAIDGVIMIAGTIAIVWFADDFIGPFQAFLVTLGVPIAAWCGIFVGDMLLRRKDYDEAALFDPGSAYGSVNWVSTIGMVVLTAIGWGLVTGSVGWLSWQGFIFDWLSVPGDSSWRHSSLGVLAVLVLGMTLPLANRGRIKEQERAS